MRYQNSLQKALSKEMGVSSGQLAARKIIVVANRLPLTVKLDSSNADGFTITQSAGGLVSALKGVTGLDYMWLGWPGNEIPSNLQPAVLEACHKQHTHPVFLDKRTIELFYNGFCNNVLWPLFHYIPPPMDFGDDDGEIEWRFYVKANHLFTSAVLAACDSYFDSDETPIVWVHDYHLMLVPMMLRQRRPDYKIGWFLHTPFPADEVFRMLPYRTEILTGLLAADLLGFHVYQYQRHFMAACLRLLGLEATGDEIDASTIGGVTVRFCSIPIGIEPSQFIRLVRTPGLRKSVVSLKEQFGNVKIVLGVDRLDYMKGIPHKLNAFDRFLEIHPEWVGKCCLVQLAVPSRTDVPEYQRLKSAAHEIVGKINGRRGTVGFVPVHYLDKSVNFHQLCTLYRAADVCLITSIQDGMNLVAFEYLACQQGKYGSLVLSEFAGASQSLAAGAISINPWNLEETAAAVHQALTMSPEEKRERHDYCFQHVLSNTCQLWAERFLDHLCEERFYESSQAHRPVPLPENDWYQDWLGGSANVLVVGVIDSLVKPKFNTSFTSTLPMSSSLRRMLESIAGDSKTHLVISSPASPRVMDSMFKGLHATLLAYSGCEYRDLDGVWHQVVSEEEAKEEIQMWEEGVWQTLDLMGRRFSGAIVERSPVSMCVYWDATQSDYGEQQARHMLVSLWAGPLQSVPIGSVDVILGSCSVEVRPRAFSRERLLTRVLELSGIKDKVTQCTGKSVCTTIAADVSEPFENMLGQQDNLKYYCITTNGGLSKAKYRLRNVDAVHRLLNRLVTQNGHSTTREDLGGASSAGTVDVCAANTEYGFSIFDRRPLSDM